MPIASRATLCAAALAFAAGALAKPVEPVLARQPFRIDGDRAYGLAIAHHKQGIATIIHSVAMLKALGFKEYGTLTVLINGDEEISSPGARAQITKNGAEHDATLSFEGTRVDSDKLSLATSGIGGVILRVKGKASHAGSSPERGINALVELSHQILQTKDLSDPATGLKMNWTNAKAGSGSHFRVHGVPIMSNEVPRRSCDRHVTAESRRPESHTRSVASVSSARKMRMCSLARDTVSTAPFANAATWSVV